MMEMMRWTKNVTVTLAVEVFLSWTGEWSIDEDVFCLMSFLLWQGDRKYVVLMETALANFAASKQQSQWEETNRPYWFHWDT